MTARAVYAKRINTPCLYWDISTTERGEQVKPLVIGDIFG
jgi:hypothetical protein